MSTIPNKYFIKKGSDQYQDVTTKFVGLTLLKIDSFNARGAAKNISIQSWVNSNNDDVNIPTTVYYEQPDITITFRVSDFDNHSVNVQQVHDNFIDYIMTNKFELKSLYTNKAASFVCLGDYKPTLEILNRQSGFNYIIGSIVIHRVTSNTNI